MQALNLLGMEALCLQVPAPYWWWGSEGLNVVEEEGQERQEDTQVEPGGKMVGAVQGERLTRQTGIIVTKTLDFRLLT